MSEEELVHVVTECAKLAFADRDALYGDAQPVPLDTLLSAAYNDERRALVDDAASTELRPGMGRLPSYHTPDDTVSLGVGEPTRGDTVHVDVADRFGNVFSATPSGGWLQSSPVIPSLGWPLGTRAQMFWLEEGLPSSLEPRTRPRTTLSPGLVLRGGEPWLAYGTPGGDQQEQWALHVLLRHVDRGLNLQEAIDAPDFHTRAPDRLVLSARLHAEPAARGGALRRGGRARLSRRAGTTSSSRRRGRSAASAPSSARTARLVAAANPRGMQGYAVAR